MGLLGKTIKLGLPAGVVYLTLKEGLWSPGTGSSEAESRLEGQRKRLAEATVRLQEAVNPYVQPIVKDVTPKMPKLPELPDFRKLWNCGVKMTISSVADFNAKACYQKVAKLFEEKPALEANPAAQGPKPEKLIELKAK